MIGPLQIVVSVLAALLIGTWWTRRHVRESQRQTMRAIHTLSEHIIAAESAAAIAENLADVLPSITQVSSVRLYLYNRANKSLESVSTDEDPEPMAIPVGAPQEGLANGAVKCFSTRTVIHIPDVRRNPLVSAEWKQGLPRSVMFLPVASKDECAGVIEAGNTRLGYFTPEEQAALEHLANQVATSIKLQEQQAVREQLFRSEKLAATGQLISGVASELRAPLEAIVELSSALAANFNGERSAAHSPELRQLAAESHRAAEIVSRLVSFARPEDLSARPADVNAVVSELVQFREPQWKARGLRVQNRLSPESISVLGSRGQLEQVFLNILVHAEQSAAAASGKSLSISSSRIAGRVAVEIQYSSDTPSDSILASHGPDADALGLDVCRGIIQSHGGEIRVVTRSGAVGFEVELPIAAGCESRTGPATVRRNARSMTLMVVDVDAAAQRQLVGLVTARGHRVVPVPPEQASDLAHRLRFDAVLWAVRAGGFKWSDSQERLRAHIPAFVLVSDGYDSELASSLAESGGYLLGRPIQDDDLERILEDVETRAAARVSS